MATLPQQLVDQLQAALAAELRKVEADEAAAFDDGSRSSAIAGRHLWDVHLVNVTRATLSGDVVKAEQVYRDISRSVSLPSIVQAEADRRTVGGFVGEVGGGIVRDVGQLAADTGKGWMMLLKASPLVLVGLAVLAVVLLTRRVTPRS